jgi:hexosaminidase
MKSTIILSAILTGFAAAESLPLIPLPVSVKTLEGSFNFTTSTAIRYDRAVKAEAELFAAELQARTGTAPKTAAEELRISLPSEIRLDIDAAADIPAGGYQLKISPKSVVITGKDAAGVYHGTRSLIQMLPPLGSDLWKDTASEKLQAVEITDYPRFAWRGMMLDVGRHFYPTEDIKRFIDWMAFHKLNVFHWHLTEDQGWRIEIKKYPKLTEVGGWRDSTPPYGNRNSDDGKRYGGFYTQEQIKEVVAYAKARHITIVPEIEMPGHAAAAITAYPEFGNDDIPGYAPKVMTRWGVHSYIFAPKEETFRFIDDVLSEVCALFPSKYIHIGGDEAPKGQWDRSPRVKELMAKEGLKDGHDVQSYFIKRVEKILAQKGRKLIGWDEIREGGLSPEANVMSWRGEKGGIDSAKEGHDVVMASNTHLYFDHYQEPTAQALAKGADKEAIGGFLPIDKVYSYNPVPKALSETEAKHVIGVQAQLWSEYLHDFAKVEYMAFPRAAALAEVAWTPLTSKNYDDFRGRLDQVMKHYDGGQLNYNKPTPPPKRETRDGSTVETSLGTHQDFWPELAFDGRADTFFWADSSLKADDHLTLHLKTALAANTTVEMATGGGNGDQLESGVLETSPDGRTWTKIADFSAGKVSGTAPAGTSHLRLRVTAPQKNWLIVREISLGKN